MNKNVKDYTENGRTISWLKNKLEEFLNDLNQYDDDTLLDLKNNTYWIKSNWFIQAGNNGFIDLFYPVSEENEEDEEDEEEFEEEFEDSLPEEEYIYSVEGIINGKIFQHRHNDLQAAKADFDKIAEKIKEIENSYVKLWNIPENKLLTIFNSETKMTCDAKEESTYQVMVMHQDYSETLHFIHAKSIEELEYKIGKIDPYYINYSIVSKEQTFKDGIPELEMALKMEKDTIAQYQQYARIAGDGDNPETQLWNHLIEDEQEHVREIEAALKGDYTQIHDAEQSPFQQSVDGVAKLLRKAKLQENVSFAEGDQTFKTVLVETPADKFDEVLSTLKEEYEIDSHNGKNRIFVKIKDNYAGVLPKEKRYRYKGWVIIDAGYSSAPYSIEGYPYAKEFRSLEEAKNFIKKELADSTTVTMKSAEQVMKEQEIEETFKDRINDVLVDGGIDYKSFRITNENRDFYVDFDSNEKDAKKAYKLLREKLFECNFVEDEGFYYVHVLRR